MARRIAPFGLVVAAAFADKAGAHGLALDAILLAVPLTAVAALGAFDQHLEGKAARTSTFLWAGVLVLEVVGAAARAPSVAAGVTPPLAEAALVGCLTLFCAQALVGVAAELRRIPTR